MITRLLGQIDRHGAALMALALSGVAVAYAISAYVSSSRLHNVIFVLPMAGLIVLLSAIVLLRAALKARGGHDATEASAAAEPTTNDVAVNSEVGPLGIAMMMALVVGYAFSIPYIGFDVASVVFMILCLWLQGERRIPFVLVFSLGFGLGVTWLLLHAARIPAHTMFL
jgi:putative tricarboxylic transport membrane protein